MDSMKNKIISVKALKLCVYFVSLGIVILLLYSCKSGQAIQISTLPTSILLGQWKTTDDDSGKEKAVVEIYQSEGKFYGKITKLLLPEDQGKVFEKGEGNEKDKPVVGLIILKDMSLDGDEYSGGTITDPNNGKVYKCKIEVLDNGEKLKLRGYKGVSLIGRTEYWNRVK